MTNSNGASRLAHVDGALPLIAETRSVDLVCFCPNAGKAGSLFPASNIVDGNGIPRTFALWRCRRLDCKEVGKRNGGHSLYRDAAGGLSTKMLMIPHCCHHLEKHGPFVCQISQNGDAAESLTQRKQAETLRRRHFEKNPPSWTVHLHT